MSNSPALDSASLPPSRVIRQRLLPALCLLPAVLLLAIVAMQLANPASMHPQLRAAWQLGAAVCTGADAALAAARDAPGAPQTLQARAKARAPAAGLLLRGDAAAALTLPSPPPLHDLSPLLPNSGYSRLYVVVGDQSGWASYVSEEYFHLYAHLTNSFNWRVLPMNAFRDPTSASDMAALYTREFGRAPDVLLFMESCDDVVRARSMASHFVDSALWLFMDDLHYDNNEAKRLWKRAGILAADLVLGAYTYELLS